MSTQKKRDFRSLENGGKFTFCSDLYTKLDDTFAALADGTRIRFYPDDQVIPYDEIPSDD